MAIKETLKNIFLWIKHNLIATVLVGIIIPTGLFVYEHNDSKNKDYLLELDNARKDVDKIQNSNAWLIKCLTKDSYPEKICMTHLSYNKYDSKEKYIAHIKRGFVANKNILSDLFKYEKRENIYIILDKLAAESDINRFSLLLNELNTELDLLQEFIATEYHKKTK